MLDSCCTNSSAWTVPGSYTNAYWPCGYEPYIKKFDHAITVLSSTVRYYPFMKCLALSKKNNMSLKRKPSTSPNNDCVTKVESHMDDLCFKRSTYKMLSAHRSRYKIEIILYIYAFES
jgi:hypothetical protein